MIRSHKVVFENKFRKKDAETVMLFIHGMNCHPPMFDSLFEEIRKSSQSLDLVVPSIPLKWYRFLDFNEIAIRLADELEEAIDKKNTKSVIICGHSAGGVLAQAVCLELYDRWDANTISVRLVAIAPMTRGWAVGHHLPLTHKLGWSIGLSIANVMQNIATGMAKLRRQPPPTLWILQLRRGAPFLVNLRLRWLQAKCDELETYVLLGSTDEIISWRDMVDDVVAGGRVKYRQIPYSNHAEVIDIDDVANDGKYGPERRRIILRAINSSWEDDSDDILWADEPPAPVDKDVKRVVFVIHGIRDEGHWTQKIAAKARQCFRLQIEETAGTETTAAGKIVTETSSYGYFSLLQFLSPEARKKKIHWLMDRYVEAKRRYPDADFSFIGHSNGTYLMAQALQEYEGVKVERVAFAGSVVTSRYDWGKLIEEGRVKHVVNLTATSDWVVSFFPRLADIFPPLRFFVGENLGGAGVVKFTRGEEALNDGWVIGQHGAAIAEFNWEALAKFAVIDGNQPPRPSDTPKIGAYYRDKANWFFTPKIGNIVTCAVVSTLLSVLVGFFWLAGLNPVAFWGGAASITCVFVLASVGISSLADQKGFAKRRRILSVAGWCLVIGGILVLLWWLVPLLLFVVENVVPECVTKPLLSGWREFGITELGEQWRGALRAVSVLGLASGVYRILTKV